MTMFGRFFKAIGTLILNTEELAGTVKEANTKLRDRLGLDAADEPDLRMIEPPAREVEGPKKGRKAS